MYKNSFIKTHNNYLICSLLGGIILFLTLTSLPMSLSQEPAISIQNTTNGTSATLSDQSKGIVQITKTGTSSFNIINESTGLLGTFDNLYTITGSSDSLLNIQLKSV
jgi:hypothetical protein